MGETLPNVHATGAHAASAEESASAGHAASAEESASAGHAASAEESASAGHDLHHHGDTEVGTGLIDLAVNVRADARPAWLEAAIRDSLSDLARYPDQSEALAAVCRRHGRTADEVLLTAGAAQAFVLIAQALRPAYPVVVHPQFTEPEAALRAAGHAVHRVVLTEPFALDPSLVPAPADLVMVGNPTNPTSVTHAYEAIAALARPGRVLVVDEAFADTLHPARPSFADQLSLGGVIVLRSLTKTWGLAGLRVGYALAEAPLIESLRAVAPLWPVATPALAAIVACLSDPGVAEQHRIAARLATERAHLVAGLRSLPGVTVAGEPSSSFALVRVPGAERIRLALRQRGYAVRRGDTFPGLGPDWLRIAVRSTDVTDTFLPVLADVLDATAREPDGSGTIRHSRR
jgi:histidinol-phosphate aminotransferase